MYKIATGIIFITTLFAIVFLSLQSSTVLPVNSEVEANEVQEFIQKFDNYSPPSLDFQSPKIDRPLRTYRKRVYTVREGDTLQGIALMFYGDSRKWQKIMEANELVLTRPELMTIGMRLTIPY